MALGLSIVALLVSNKFSFFHTGAKFLGIATTLVFVNFWVAHKKINFYMPNSKHITRSFLISFLCLLVSICLNETGEPITGLSLILLWAIMTFAISAIARDEGSSVFLKRFVGFQIPFYALMYLLLLYHEIFVKSNSRPFFGNPNIASNFVAISLLQILFFIQIQKNRIFKVAAILLLISGLFLIYSLGGRAPMLGFLVGCGTLLALSSFGKKLTVSRTNKIILFLVGCLLLCLSGFFFFKKGISSLEIRYSFWRNTLCLIKDHPLGVGPGSFEYIFQQYNGKCYPAAESAEGLLVRNPHNMFLEFMAELGIVGAFSFFAFLFFIFREIKKNLALFPLEGTWVLCLASFFATLAFFEFPQDTPYTLFVLSILLGFSLSLLKSQKNTQSASLRVINFSAAVVVAFIFYIKGYSDHLTLLPGTNKHKSYERACALNNENWRACVFLGLSYINKGEYEKAELLIKDLSKKFNGHHSLLHLKGSLADKRGDFKAACEEFKKYHLLFDQKTSKKEYLEKNCK